MSQIDLKNVSVEFPIYNVSARSLKKSFIRLATGGSVVPDVNKNLVVKALSNMTLSIRQGDRIGLIGHNGAGKSSLLRLLAGIYEPTQGVMHTQGHISPLLNFTLGMEPEFTGFENIMQRGAFLGYSRTDIKKKMGDIAAFSGLGDYLSMPVRTYSSGMMLRLAFSISVNIEPDISLMDEVFSTGDESFMKTAKARMEKLMDQSNIVVMANHSNDIIRSFCNKALLMENGMIKFYGSVEKAIALYNTNT